MITTDADHHPIMAPFNVHLSHTEVGWIGMFAILWSQLEFLVECGIYDLRGQSLPEGRETVLPATITKRIALLASLADELENKPHASELIGACERATALARLRNIALHGNWMPHHELGEVAAVSWFKVPDGEPLNALPFSTLPGLCEEAGEVGLRMYRLFEARPLFTSLLPASVA